MPQIFFIGVALLLVFEGILPFLAPRIWRRMMQQMLMQSDRTLHVMGFGSMIMGVMLLYWVH